MRKDTGIECTTDLAGKVVVTTSCITTGRVARTVIATRNLPSPRFRTVSKHGESLAMMPSRQADTFLLDEAILAGLLANSPDAGSLKLPEENSGFEPYGIGMRSEDSDFKKLVDGTLIGMIKSGELERLYSKWFVSPIPLNNVNLQLPMSEMLRNLLRNPSVNGI